MTDGAMNGVVEAGGAWPSAAAPEADRAWAACMVHLVAAVTGVEAQAIAGPRRNAAPASRARQMAMYLAYTGLGWTLERTGFAFGRNRSTVSHAVQRVEDCRDRQGFDRRLAALEGVLRALSNEGLAL